MKQQVYWGWNNEEIELYGENGEVIYKCHPKFYVNHKQVLAQFDRTTGNCSLSPWEKSKAFTKKYGITPTNVARKFNGIRYEQVIKMHPDWAGTVQTRKGRIKPTLFESIESVDLVEQAIKDGLKNITPFIVMFNASPKELKKRFGDKIWKKLCKNTYTRNRLIFHISHQARFGMHERAPEYFDNYPSTLLKNKWYNRDYRAVKLALQVAGCSMAKMEGLENIRVIARVCDMWADTKRMCEARGITFNPNWSWRRIQEEHEKMLTEQQREFQRRKAEQDEEYAKLLAVDFRTLHKGLKQFVFKSGIIATPLTNMEQVQSEGQNMRHCVGGYASICAKGDYIVYHLTKCTQEATLGISCFDPMVSINGKVDRAATYKFNQMYHACNKIVEDADFVKAAEEIVDSLNKSAKISKPNDIE